MALWTPSLMTTALWLDAADGDTLTLDGSAVSAWDDKSGNSRHASQGTPANRPARSGTLNALDVITFDGSNDRLQIAGAALGNTEASDLSVFFVGQQASGTFGTMLSCRTLGGSVGWTLRNNSTTEITYFHVAATPSLTLARPSSYSLIELIRDGLDVSLGIDGDIESATTLSGYPASATALFIGAENTGTSSFLNGGVAEIVVLSEVASTDNRQKIEGYLAHKWGIEGSLDSGHPYKSAAPALFSISGTVKDASAAFAARKVLAYREDTDALSGSATSDGTTGAFEIFVPPVKHRVVITGESDRNDLIFAGVEPV